MLGGNVDEDKHVNIKNKTSLWLLVPLVAACQGGADVPDSTEPESSEPVGQLAAGPERVVEITRHAVLAFREDQSALVGGYRTHRASVRDGAVAFTPYTFDAGERRAREAALLETTSITAGDDLIASAATASRLDDGSILVDRDGVTEVLSNTEEGLHQEWAFPTRPTTEGDVVVEVTVDGYHYTGSTQQGLHFASASGAGMRYSHAVWIGANGQEWPIGAEFADDRIRMIVPASIVELTEFPARLDPTVSAEVAADAPVVGPTGANQQNARVAFGGGQYLVVWADNRDSTDSDIWGTRVSAAGAILDPLGIQIAAGPGAQGNPTVAWTGSTFVVAWEDYKVADGTEADIDAATVSSAGAVTALPSVATGAANQVFPVLGSRGAGDALLTWNAGGTLSAAAFTGSFGAPTQLATGTVVERAGVAGDPAGNYLVTYSAATELKGQLVTPAGALSGAAFDVSAGLGTQSQSSATWTGSSFGVVYVNNRSGINVYGARVSSTGTVLDTHLEGTATVGGTPISTAVENQELPVIACATNCVVAWQERRNLATTSFDIYGQLLNSNFTLSGGEIVISSSTGRQNTPSLASSGSGYLAVWPDLRDNNAFATYGSTVSTAGAVGTASPLGTGNTRESNPALGRASGTYGLFWSNSAAPGNDIKFVRFGGGGAKLDTTALTASNGGFAQISPAASTELGTTNALVVWSDTRNGNNKDIYGARVTMSSGAVVDTSGIAISTAANDQLVPDVASNNTVALVVWQDRRGADFDIYGAIVDANGAVTVPDIVISNAAQDQVRPAVTWDPVASQFIVVWQDLRNGTTYSIFGARVSAAGAVLDTNGVQISNGAVGQFTPAIAGTTAGTLVAWQDRKNAPAVQIWGSRVVGGASLTVTDTNGFRIGNSAGRQSGPKIGTIGTSAIVLWVDDRAGQDDIYGQQVSNGLLSGTEFVVSNTTDPEDTIAVVGAGGTGTSLRVAYESHRLSSARASTRVITSQTNQGSACSGPSQCQSGFCVDGFCCESACGGNHVAVAGTTAGDCHGCANRFTGQPNGTCAPLPTTAICRNYASTYCDDREYCDGVNTDCPPDLGRRQGATCAKSTNTPPGVGNGVCPPNAAPGPHFCQ